MYLVLFLSISQIHIFHVFHTRTECFNNSTCFTIFTMFHKVSQNILRNACEILHTDFTEMAELQKFWFAAAMLPESIPTATMLTAASQLESQC